MIVDGKNAILGRLGAFVAKELLKGGSVDIINSEEVVVSGKKEFVAAKIKAKRDMGTGGSLKGPKYIRQSDRLLKRMIRGMLPRTKERGREAFKRLKCYIGNGAFKEDELKNVVVLKHKTPMRFTTVKEIVRALK